MHPSTTHLRHTCERTALLTAACLVFFCACITQSFGTDQFKRAQKLVIAKDPKAAAALVAILFDAEQYTDERWAAARLLKQFNQAQLTGPLGGFVRSAEDADPGTLTGWNILLQHGDYSWTKGLSQMLMKVVLEGEGQMYDLDMMEEAIGAEDVVWPAVEAAGRLHIPELSKLIIDILNGKDKAEWVDRRGVYALGAGGFGLQDKGKLVAALGLCGQPESVPILIKLLEHKKEWLRDEACFGLGQIGKPAIPALTATLKNHKALKATIDPALDKFMHFDLKPGVVPSWRKAAGGRIYIPAGQTVSRYAARALGYMGIPEAALPLHEAFKAGGSGPFRQDVIAALLRVDPKNMPTAGAPAWALTRAGKEEYLPLVLAQANLASLQGNEMASETYSMASAIVSIGDFKTVNEEVREQLRNALRSGRTDEWKLIHIGTLNRTELFYDIAYNGTGWDGFWSKMMSCQRALGKLQDRKSIPMLRKRVNDRNLFVALTAASALGKMGDPSGLEAAMFWMRSKKFFVHGSGFVDMIDTDTPDEMTAKGHQWRHIESPNFHFALAADALGDIGGEEAIAILSKRNNQMIKLQNKKRDVYRSMDMLYIAAALNKLGRHEDAMRGYRSAVSVYEDVPFDPDQRFLRLGAMYAIGKIGEPSSRALLKKIMLHDGVCYMPYNYNIREVARGAWERCTGIRSPDDDSRSFTLAWMF